MEQANVTRLMIMLMAFFYQNQYLQAQQIAGDTVCSFAVCSENTAQGWGDNGNGTLGDGNIDTFSIVPVSVAMTDVIAVASGGKHTLGLKKDGTVWTWGLNSRGELGDNTTMIITFLRLYTGLQIWLLFQPAISIPLP